jgi:streptogramin lyase/lysophospholipase L1-like esterase
MKSNLLQKPLLVLTGILWLLFSATAQIPDYPAAFSVLGQENFSDKTSGVTASKFNGPNGVAVDIVSGKVFVVDRSNHRVLRWASEEAIITGSEAEAVFGQSDFTSNSSGLSATKFNNPIGIHIDLEGRMWIGDFGNRRVLRFDNASVIPSGSEANAVLGQPDFTTNSTGNTAQKLGGPVGLYVDNSGILWVSDWSNHRVVYYVNAANLANGSAADGVLGQADFGMAAGATTQTGMKNPNDLYVDAGGRLWVSDAANRRVLRFDNARNLPNGAPADGVLGQTEFNTDISAITQSGFTNLRFVTGDNSGRIYVMQENSHRIVVFENAANLPNGAPADNIWGQPDFTSGTAMNPPTASSFNTPRAMFVDEARETVWVADFNNHRVLRFFIDFFPNLVVTNNPSGVSVIGQDDFASNGPGLSASKLNGPNGIAVDPSSGKVFVVDRSNHRILRWSSDEAIISGSPAEAVFGQTDFNSNSTGLSASNFNNPIGIHIDNMGRMWVGDFGNRRILRFDNASTIASGVDANAVLGQPDFSTNSAGNSAEKLGGPVGIFADHTGSLWVSDWSNHRVVYYLDAANQPNGSPADGVLGQAAFGLAIGATTQTGMKNPNDVYVDNFGRLWVSDASNRRVLRFDNARNLADGAPADGVLGQTDFTSDISAISQSGFTNLRFVTGDHSGRIYVMQENSHRIVVFDDAANLANGAPADYVWGQPDFNSGAALNPPTASSFNTPRAMYVDQANGNVWIADYNNHRVVRYLFFLEGQSVVQIISPFGGENWAQFTNQQISWTSNLIDNVKIEFSGNGGTTWQVIDEGTPAATGSYLWYVSAPFTNQAQIRISDAGNADILSVSGLFNVVPLTSVVTLHSPDGYQQWEEGSQKFILFAVENVQNVKIEYTLDDGNTWNLVEEAFPASESKYLWALPETTSDQCKVRITDVVSGATDMSGASFSIVPPRAANQDIVFFSDSPTPNFYDPSWGTATAPSTLEIINTKWPVTTNFSLVGNYSLKLNYKSVEGGNWAIAVASMGWVGHDFTTRDTISIKVFSETPWESQVMPYIYLEDLSNKKTEKFPLGDFVQGISANQWTEFRIPVEPFIENPLQADLTRIKTIFFSQYANDNTQRIVYFDDIRVEGEDINGNEVPVFVVLGSSTAAGTGASSASTSWVGLFRTYVQTINPDAVVVNLAVGGFTSYHVMPTGFVPPAGRPQPSPNNNITKALAYNPIAVIINLPSNDAANNYSIDEQMANFAVITGEFAPDGIPFRVTTTQPRNFSNPAQLQNLIDVRTAIINAYGTDAVNIFDELAQPDGTIKPFYNSGDGIHLNDAGHNYIYEEIIGSGIATILGSKQINRYNTSGFLFQNYPNPASSITYFPVLLESKGLLEIAVYNLHGQKVATIVNDRLDAGNHLFTWDCSHLPSGVYVSKAVLNSLFGVFESARLISISR